MLLSHQLLLRLLPPLAPVMCALLYCCRRALSKWAYTALARFLQVCRCHLRLWGDGQIGAMLTRIQELQAQPPSPSIFFRAYKGVCVPSISGMRRPENYQRELVRRSSAVA